MVPLRSVGNPSAAGRGTYRWSGGIRGPFPVRPERVEQTRDWLADEDGSEGAIVAVRQGVAGSAVAPGLRRTGFPRASPAEDAE